MPILALGRPETATAIASQGRHLGLRIRAAPILHLGQGDLQALEVTARQLGAGGYDGLCVTSSAAVDALAAALDRTGTPTGVLRRLVVGSVGSGTTRRLAQRLNVAPSVVPAVATGAHLGQAIGPGAMDVLLPHSDLASGRLQTTLEANGHACTSVVAYRTTTAPALPPTARAALREGVTLVAVTSPSCARAWASLAPDEAGTIPAVSIGPVTTAECERLDLPVVAEARPHDTQGVAAALARAWQC